jgi:hypothetical protein
MKESSMSIDEELEELKRCSKKNQIYHQEAFRNKRNVFAIGRSFVY